MKKVSSFLLIIFFITVKSRSQDVFKHNINTNHGLPSNTIYDLLQDSDGFIWIATREGVVRYDGTYFKEYKSDNSSSAIGSHLKMDKQNRIWYETFDGNLRYIDADSVKSINQKTPIGFMNFVILKDTLTYMSKNGVQQFNLKTKKQKSIRLEPNFIPNYITDLNQKVFLFEGAKNILMFNNNSTYKQSLSIDSIDSPIYFKAKNTIFIADKSNKNPNFYFLKGSKFQTAFNIKSDAIIQKIVYFDQQFWICTNNGLMILDDDGNLRKHFLKKNSITSILKDHNNIFWIGTHNNGIFKIENFDDIAIDLSILKPLKINKEQNQLVIGNEFGELFKTNLNFDYLEKIKFKSTNEISLINTTHPKFNFIVSNGLIQTDKKFKIVARQNFAAKSIHVLNSSEIVFAGTGLSGFKKINTNSENKSEFDDFEYTSGLKYVQTNIRGKICYPIPNTNQILFGSNQGLFLYENNVLQELKHANKTLFINYIGHWNNQILLASTTDQIYILQNNTLRLFKSYKDKITTLQHINGALFLTTKNKIYEWNGKDFRQIHTNISDKIIDLEANKDNLYILLSDQLVKVDRNHPSNVIKSNKLIIEDMFVNGKIIKFNQHNFFNYNQNNVEISFSKVDFSSIQKPVIYSINNSEWTELTNTNILRLAALSPNEYKIEMRIKDGDKNTQVIQFTIEKPYWQQNWFVLLIFLAGTLIFIMIYKYRISILSKKKNLEIDKITLENHLNENRLKLIKAQMNPHFFFNALNTIQSYITTNETEEATIYLSQFSKLTRLILEMTDKNSIMIEEEMKVQNLYLSLQKIRFNDFYFEIECQPKYLEKAHIPTMLIQPYIENAIIHGLSHKKGLKNLKISFTETENNRLEIVILDNGIGIKKANEINSKSKTKSASFATKATLERIEIINRNNFTIKIETNEIIENEVPKGTEIKIQMNLEYESI